MILHVKFITYIDSVHIFNSYLMKFTLKFSNAYESVKIHGLLLAGNAIPPAISNY